MFACVWLCVTFAYMIVQLQRTAHGTCKNCCILFRLCEVFYYCTSYVYAVFFFVRLTSQPTAANSNLVCDLTTLESVISNHNVMERTHFRAIDVWTALCESILFIELCVGVNELLGTVSKVGDAASACRCFFTVQDMPLSEFGYYHMRICTCAPAHAVVTLTPNWDQCLSWSLSYAHVCS